MKRVFAAALIALAAACAPEGGQTRTSETATTPPASAAPVNVTAPAGAYTTDPAHSTLIVRMSHLGFSNYTASFSRFTINLMLDPQTPANSTVAVTIDPRSLTLPNPPAGFLNDLLGPNWLNASAHREITFRSTRVEQTAPNAARITGDLTLNGQTHPITLEATYNGSYPGFAMDPHARIGFSARGNFSRSAFGIAYGVPAAGSNMGVSDNVEIIVETELTGPAWSPTTGQPAAPASP